MIKNFDIKNLWTTLEAQHRDELEKYNISPETLPQLMTSIAAISLFPFVAKPIVSAILMEIGTNFNDYLKMREDFAADFTIRAIRK
jgi:hypothetical protein